VNCIERIQQESRGF